MAIEGKRGEAYRSAVEQAQLAFASRPMRDAALAAGAQFDPVQEAAVLPLFGTAFRVSDQGRVIVRAVDGASAHPAERILILHYLAAAAGDPPAGRQMSFREFPGARFYDSTFRAHTVQELAGTFANDEGAFEAACRAAGGKREQGSGVRMEFLALPKVRVTLCYWAGEDDMPAGAQVLFDASATSFLPVEDIAVVGESLVHRVVNAARGDGAVSLYEYD